MTDCKYITVSFDEQLKKRVNVEIIVYDEIYTKIYKIVDNKVEEEIPKNYFSEEFNKIFNEINQKYDNIKRWITTVRIWEIYRIFLDECLGEDFFNKTSIGYEDLEEIIKRYKNSNFTKQWFEQKIKSTFQSLGEYNLLIAYAPGGRVDHAIPDMIRESTEPWGILLLEPCIDIESGFGCPTESYCRELKNKIIIHFRYEKSIDFWFNLNIYDQIKNKNKYIVLINSIENNNTWKESKDKMIDATIKLKDYHKFFSFYAKDSKIEYINMCDVSSSSSFCNDIIGVSQGDCPNPENNVDVSKCPMNIIDFGYTIKKKGEHEGGYKQKYFKYYNKLLSYPNNNV
jgi:hypothetical protein